jgi:site-specific recombinase XerD
MRIHQAHQQYVRWLLATKDLSPHTIRAYDSDVAAFGKYLGMRALVSQIDHECLVAFVEELRASGLSAMSIRRRASGLRGFCKWLLASRLLEYDPWNGMILSAGRQRKLPRIVPAHELDRLFASLLRETGVGEASDPDKILTRPHECTTLLAVALMVATGVRVGELVNIKCVDIDLSSRSFRIVGKGRRERHVFLTNDWITSLTCAYIEARNELGLEQAQLLFNSCHEPLTTQAMRSRLAKAAFDAGLSV